jgi:hypothetical protein
MMRLALAEKGVLWIEVSATGVGGHSFQRPARRDRSVAARPGADGAGRAERPAVPSPARAGVRTRRRRRGGPAVGQRRDPDRWDLRQPAGASASARLDLRVPPGSVAGRSRGGDRPTAAGHRVRRGPGSRAGRPNWSGTDVPFVSAFAQVAEQVRAQDCVPTVPAAGERRQPVAGSAASRRSATARSPACPPVVSTTTRSSRTSLDCAPASTRSRGQVPDRLTPRPVELRTAGRLDRRTPDAYGRHADSADAGGRDVEQGGGRLRL